MSSTLNVTITRVGGGTAGAFIPSYVVKSVPKALWGEYVQAHDPIMSRDPEAFRAEMFNGENATLDLATGVSILSPDPAFAKSPIPIFNPTAAANRPVSSTSSWLGQGSPDG